MSRSRGARRLALAACLSLLAQSLLASPAHAAAVTVTNGTQFTDTTGAVVHAHGGGVIKVGGYYYWFGENRNADNTFRVRLGLPVDRPEDLGVPQQRADPEVGGRAAASANIERPKVIYNAATGQYVMWMHKENGSDYGEARAAVASSATVDGNYTYQGSFRPLGNMSRDITLLRRQRHRRT